MDADMEIDDPKPTVSNPFIFSRPSAVSDLPRIINFGVGSDHIFDVQSTRKNVFTFAPPTIVSQYDQTSTNLQADNRNRHKPKIPRPLYKPPLNVFANALKDTGAFDQLKKNTRSRTQDTMKINIENTIKCSGVPQALLNKIAAKKYFRNYGNIMRINIRPRRHIITVTYMSKDEANTAYYKGGNYMNETFHIEWAKEEPIVKSPIRKKNIHNNLVTNLLKTTDYEVLSELEAMANLEYNLPSTKVPEIPDIPARTRIPGGKMALLQEKATLKLEKVAAKVEKHEAESQITNLLPNTPVEELQNIIHQVALTTEDKYKVLEARDRLMRLKRVKPASLATAKTTSGTCPDMCPEKERLMRESQRQVSPYEQIDGNEYKINHATAVKQYSRSSADQEEPMSHELRPVKSLKMTMSYLLHEIVDLCDQQSTNLAEWYHFLWDRTRGIRKDITQQELCCKDSVELIEQCARFHIVCSEKLCEEDASVFDKKINSENLTKCLQTLKYMYQDLREKGIACENEPEFRAYIVLLNLNNGSFMYDLQQLPKSVQNSPEIQFATKVYFALSSNNYNKFFKLVRQTTYMNTCILLRYFSQVRMRAFSIMVKAYCRSTSTAFPLYDLIDILAFEDEDEIMYFCEQVGLNLSSDEMYILLNRQNFNISGTHIQQRRPYELIKSKTDGSNFSIGKYIAGGKMPSKTYENHKPHNSFDAYGNLLPESTNAEDQNSFSSDSFAGSSSKESLSTEKEMRKIPKLTQDKNPTAGSPMHIKKQPMNNESSVPKPVSEPVSLNVIKTVTFEPDVSTGHKQKIPSIFESKPPSTLLKAFDNENAIVSAARRENTTISNKHSTIFGSNSSLMNNPFANNSVVFPKQSETSRSVETVATPFAVAVNKSIFSGTGTGNIFMKGATSSPTVFSGNRFPAAVSAQQSTVCHTSVANKVTPPSDIFHKKEPVQKDAQEDEKARLEKLEHAKRMRQIEERSEEIYNNLHAEVIQEFCFAIAKEHTDRIKMYDMLSEKHAGDVISEVIREMCDAIITTEIANQQKLQEIMLKVRNQIMAKCFNAWRRYILKKRRQRLALEDTPVWLQRQSLEECAKMLYTKEQDIVIRNMRKKRLEQKEEHVDESEKLAPVELIVRAGIKENLRLLDVNPLPNVFWKLVISWPDLSNKAVLWQHKKVMNRYLYPEDFTMEPIVKIYMPNPYEALHICVRYFEGFISEQNLIGTDAFLFIADASEDCKSVARRLTKTVLSRHKLMPIPLTFIVLGSGNLEHQNESIVSELESLLESGYVSEYTIMFEKNLTAKVILNLTQSAILWLTMNKSPINPLEMDYLHNVYDICLSEELWLRILGDAMFNKQLSNALKDPNFIIDLHNEAVNHLMDIILDPESTLYTSFAPEFKQFLKSDHVMPCGYEYFNESWKRDEYRAELEATMNSFVLPPWNAPWPIIDVRELRRRIMNYCTEVLSDANCNIVLCDIFSNFSLTSDNLQVSNFVQVLLHVIKEKISLLDGDQTVIYNKNHIKHFRTLPWWFKSNVLTEFMSRELNSSDNDLSSYEILKKKARLDRSYDNLNESALDEEFESLAEFCEDTKNQVMEVHLSCKDIEKRLQAQRLQNVLLEDKLRNALLDEIEMEGSA
ncbi:uncharacterized protein LOC105184744 [Harpegnathos saltator]|uniref:Protein xmas-2 n=1 Tax=Harpegnathos saltator TaxID=610380 RepID=E2BNA1_HARSA|nr:uncharacterized protein LOC105184744 [Harpegnathos saltator]XP_019697704.1 uncharacterized protein LOC105184744 [Harpegnathos saltator]XP_025154535.1 uncharacterized protein LOC105184744 [Harpegnathos saltator]EFN82863.1 Protein xmas-2 [Harpegnathos saltator]